MTPSMGIALRRLAQVPESEQDRVARRVLSLPELASTEPEAPSLVSIIASAPGSYARSKAEIDGDLNRLRGERSR